MSRRILHLPYSGCDNLASDHHGQTRLGPFPRLGGNILTTSLRRIRIWALVTHRRLPSSDPTPRSDGAVYTVIQTRQLFA